MSIFKGSRYTNTPTYYPSDGKNRKIFCIREKEKFSNKTVKYHTWINGDTLDYLSFTLYGDSKYWWALLDANPQYQSELDIKAGDLLFIPPFNEVVRNL